MVFIDMRWKVTLTIVKISPELSSPIRDVSLLGKCYRQNEHIKLAKVDAVKSSAFAWIEKCPC
jgi:hypothetical protein